LKGGFPTVVGPEAVTPNNTAGGIHFDSTVDVFDPLVVSEYLSGTGNAGGPLVTSFNESSKSDLRLYESDKNETMIALKGQGAGFQNVCKEMMRRMVETVPKGVSLGNEVEVMAVKPINATLDFDASGGVVFKGVIRVSFLLFLIITKYLQMLIKSSGSHTNFWTSANIYSPYHFSIHQHASSDPRNRYWI
jgi:hypothetical protein